MYPSFEVGWWVVCGGDLSRYMIVVVYDLMQPYPHPLPTVYHKRVLKPRQFAEANVRISLRLMRIVKCTLNPDAC